MQLHSENSVVNTTIQSSAQTFSIQTSKKAFKVLSSSLYKNKIKAIIRELSTNAIDAHLAAKNKDPFIIHLPSKLDPTFYVQDFGTGLSPDQVISLYTTYFASTKADSDEMIGALGLGSKSPFAYTDSFSIESVYDGIKSIYNAYLNEEGLPNIVSVDAVKTSEHPGMKISFAVMDRDTQEFVNETIKVLYAFETAEDPFRCTPTVTGGYNFNSIKSSALSKISVLFENSKWTLYKVLPDFLEANYRCNSSINMGGVIYPLNSSVFEPFLEREPYVKFVLRNRFLITMKVGSCDIAPSREDLSYDKETISNLLQTFKSIYSEFERGKIYQNILDDESYGPVYNRLSKIYAIDLSIENAPETVIVDKKSNTSYKLHVDFQNRLFFNLSIPSKVVNLYSIGKGNNRYRLETQDTSTTDLKSPGINRISFIPSENLVVFEGDNLGNSSYQLSRIKEYLKQTGKNRALILEGFSSARDRDILGNPEILTKANLPKQESATQSSSKPDPEVTDLTGKVKADLVKDTQERYFILSKYKSIYIQDSTKNPIKLNTGRYFALSTLGDIFTDKEVFIVPYSSYTFYKLGTKANWKFITLENIQEIICNRFEIHKEYYRKYLISRKSWSYHTNLLLELEKYVTDPNSVILKHISELKACKNLKEDAAVNSEVSCVLELARDITQYFPNISLPKLQNIVSYRYSSFEDSLTYQAEVFSTYPLLGILTSISSSDGEYAKKIGDYINLINKASK